MTREEAINTVQNIYQTDKEKEALAILIPELLEREDENPKKWLLDYLHYNLRRANGRANGPIEDHLKSAIDWLKKQKESSISAEEVLIKAGLKPYKDGNQWCVLVGDNIQEGICGFGNTIEDALYQFLMEILETQKEQKKQKEQSVTIEGRVIKNGPISYFKPFNEQQFSYLLKRFRDYDKVRITITKED